MTLADYKTLVFDCDGVVLDSNRVKTEAFRHAVAPYGPAASQAMVDWHTANGGISRYRKFEHFLAELAPAGTNGPGLDGLLDRYASAVVEGLSSCAIAPGLADLRAATPAARWLIVSGGDQAELRALFAARDLADMFDGGIFGSPDNKDEILSREMARGNIAQPALFLGDSTYDHKAASAAGIDFVFVHGWSEVVAWQDFVAAHNLNHIAALADLSGT